VFQRPHQPSDRALRKDYRFTSRALAFDLAPVLEELERENLEWLDSQWKWHIETRFSILRAGERRGYPGSELTHGHSINQPNLERLTHLRGFLDSAFPVRPTMAWLGHIPRGGRIFLHVDNTQHWDEHHRVHVPLITNPEARLCVDGHFLFLRPGRLWLLNNSVPHGALNRGPDRLHLALDLPHFDGFDEWLAQGTAEPGTSDDAALAELNQDPLSVPAAARPFDSAHSARLLAQ
jgi:hypothetical protein